MAQEFTRRTFLRLTAAGVARSALGPYFLFPKKAEAQRKVLKIIQFSHFVPEFDHWFDHVFCKTWGDKHDTTVMVDHITVSELPSRAAAEAAARHGHDLFDLQSPPAAYEKLVIDHKEIYREVERKHGKPVALAIKSTFNPKTGKYYAFSPSYVPDVGNYRKDLWEQVGYPNGPDTWDDLRTGSKKIYNKLGNPCGLGLSQEVDSNMSLRALLWSFGGSEQDEHGNVAINSKATIEALKFMRALFKESETAEVFTWDATSNNRAMLSGRASYAMNPISITRTAEKHNPDMSRKIQVCQALKGPARRVAPPDPMDCYLIWDFAENKEGAQQFLIDYADDFAAAFRASQSYNFPSFPGTVPDLASLLANDASATPTDKYKKLSNVQEWITNVGFPGYATPALDEVFNTFMIPTMFARVARDRMSPEGAASDAERQMNRIFAKWK